MAGSLAIPGNGRATVIVVDAMEIRRSGIVSLLSSWAAAENLHLDPLDVEGALKAIEQDRSARLIIFNAGGDSIAERATEILIQRLHDAAPEIPLVILSDRKDAEDFGAAVSAGAMGYVHTGSALDLARYALSFIVRGGSYFPISFLREIQLRTAARPGPAEGNRPAETGFSVDRDTYSSGGETETSSANGRRGRACTFTPRQTAVLECLRHGDSNKLIARRLSVSETTVKVHIRQIMRKLGAVNRTQAAVICNGSFVEA